MYNFWTGSPLGRTPVIVTMETPQVKCLGCGLKTWHQPTFAEGQRQIPKGIVRFIESWLSRLTIQHIVEAFGVSESGTVRIGDYTRVRTFLAGVRGVTTGVADGVAVQQRKLVTAKGIAFTDGQASDSVDALFRPSKAKRGGTEGNW